MSTPVVKINKLDDEFVQIRTDKKLVKESYKMFEKLTKYYISTTISIQMPSFVADFPEEIPKKLMYPGINLMKNNKPKVKKERSTLEEEAEKFIKEEPSTVPERKRRTRFSGSYNFEELNKSQLAASKRKRTASEVSTFSSTSSSSRKVQPLKINLGKVPAGKQEKNEDFSSSSGSSSDSSDEEEEKPVVNCYAPKVLSPPKAKAPQLSDSSSDEEEIQDDITSGSVVEASKVAVVENSAGKVQVPALLDETNVKSQAIEEQAETLQAHEVQTEVAKQSVISETPQKQDLPEEILKAVPKKEQVTEETVQETQNAVQETEEIKPVPENSSKIVNNGTQDKSKVSKTQTKVSQKVDSKTKEKPSTSSKAVQKESSKSVKKEIEKKSYEKPKVIDAPMMNPKTLKPIKRLKKPPPNSDNSNNLSNLGGIFSIDNGWDKNVQQMKEQERQAIEMLPKIPKIRQLPKISTPAIDHSDIEAAHNTYFELSGIDMSGERLTPDRDVVQQNPMKGQDFKLINFVSSQGLHSGNDDAAKLSARAERFGTAGKVIKETPQVEESPKPGKFDRFDSGNDSDSDDELLKNQKSKKNFLSSDSETEIEEEEEKKEPEASEESDSLSPVYNDETVDDVECLLMDDDNLDDLVSDDEDEYLPPKSYQRKPPQPKPVPVILTAELDELKMKITKEKPATSRDDFDHNTNLIIQRMMTPVESPAELGLKRFFSTICPKFIDNQICSEKCKMKHEFQPMNDYRGYFQQEKVPLKEVDELYGVCVAFQKLFVFFFPLFTDLYVMKTKTADLADVREEKIARLIMDCERTPRIMTDCYKQIVSALEKDMPRYKAIQLLIKHYQVSDIADEVILPMAFETDGDLFRLLPYLKAIERKRNFSLKELDSIIANCVEYGNFQVSYFCLNSLIILAPHQFRQLNREKVAGFFLFLQEIVDAFKNRQFLSKVEAIAQNVAGR